MYLGPNSVSTFAHSSPRQGLIFVHMHARDESCMLTIGERRRVPRCMRVQGRCTANAMNWSTHSHISLLKIPVTIS
eukprot:scaffold217355_cov32-Tisochrysis_lutea.AAC.2